MVESPLCLQSESILKGSSDSDSLCFLCVCNSPQRQAKYLENKLKSIKARNEYLLTLEASNSSVFKYYIHDLPDLIDVSMEVSGSVKSAPKRLRETLLPVESTHLRMNVVLNQR